MKNFILTALALVGLIHYGSSAQILKGRLVASGDTTCLSILGTATAITEGDTTVCGMILLSNADAGGYIIADADDATKQLTLGAADGAVSSVTATGTALSFKGDPAISGLTKNDFSLVINKNNPFRIVPKTGITDTQSACLKKDTTYSLTTDATACADQTWYFEIDDCTAANCDTCSLGAGMCTSCDDMYALKSATKCTACTEANANCNACAYSTADTPALECSGCKDGYTFKAEGKTCEKDEDSSALMQTASALAVMVTIMLGMLQRYNY